MLSKYLNEWWFEWNINEKKKLYQWMSFGFHKKCISFLDAISYDLKIKIKWMFEFLVK
jgi:hypothetical protein